VPEHSGSFYTTYELQSGPAAGLGFGVGVIHVGDRPATAANIFIQDAYTVFDTQLFYNFGDYEALFSVSNVGDENYRNVTFDGSPNGVLPGAPTSYRLSLARRF
jgi:iron complex outermembrane receptor protein